MGTVPINLVVEDPLSEAVLRKILLNSSHTYEIGRCYCKGGNLYIKNNMRGFNNAAKGTPFLVLTDLDNRECAPVIITEWLTEPRHPNLLFRVAIREVEAWILSNSLDFSKFLGISRTLIPAPPDEINNPKEALIGLARRSRKRNIRESIVPRDSSKAKVGPNYNGVLISFVEHQWNIADAAKNSPSLKKIVNAVNNFTPCYE